MQWTRNPLHWDQRGVCSGDREGGLTATAASPTVDTGRVGEYDESNAKGNLMPSRLYILAARRHVKFFVRGKRPEGVARLSLGLIQHVAHVAVRQALHGSQDLITVQHAAMGWDHEHGERGVFLEDGSRRNITMPEASYVASVAITAARDFVDRCPPQE